VQSASRGIGPTSRFNAALKISALFSIFSSFIEWARLFGPKAFIYGRIGPHYHHFILNARGEPLAPKGLKFGAIGPYMVLLSYLNLKLGLLLWESLWCSQAIGGHVSMCNAIQLIYKLPI